MSSFEAEVKKITYVFCDREDHTSEPLSRVCVDEKCENKTLICALCEEFNHKNHETLPLKNYLTQAFGGSVAKKFQESPLFFTNRIDVIRNDFFKSISDYRVEVLDMLKTLQIQGKMFFNQISQEVISLLHLQNPIETLKKQSRNQTKLKDLFRLITKTVNLHSVQKFSLAQKLEVAVTNCDEKHQLLMNSLAHSRADLEASLAKLSSSLNVKQALGINNVTFKWSETLKGHKISIKGAFAEQTGMQSSGQRFALIEPAVSSLGSSKKMRWGIRVIKFVGWVGIGICLKKIISQGNYHFNYNNIGHGSYLISSNGYSWSHSVKEYNSACKTFQFNINDIIYIEYDPVESILRFRKNEGGDVFVLAIVPPPPGDEYCPCANICSTGDSVELINPGMALS